MKTDTTHLPAKIQTDLNHITEFLIRDYEVAASFGSSNKQTCATINNIILHGCFTEDHWQPDTEINPAENHYSYNILIIVTKILPDSLYKIQEVAKQLNQSDEVEHPIRLQIETVSKANKLLKDGYIIYDKIQEHGILLYNSGGKGLNLFYVPDRPNAAKHYIRAKEHFDRIFPLAQSFLSGARFFKNNKDLPAAAFMLNISAEQAYEAFLLVHILYYPYSRTLMDLRETAESIHQELQFVWAGREGRKSFFKLKCAFKGPRYTPDFTITEEELNRILKYVKALHKLVHYICQLKLETLRAGSLEKPDKDWLDILTDAENAPELDIKTAPPCEQGEFWEKMHRLVFNLEDPCEELLDIGEIIRGMVYDGEQEHRGIHFIGNAYDKRVASLKGTYNQMMELLRETRIDVKPDKKEVAND